MRTCQQIVPDWDLETARVLNLLESFWLHRWLLHSCDAEFLPQVKGVEQGAQCVSYHPRGSSLPLVYKQGKWFTVVWQSQGKCSLLQKLECLYLVCCPVNVFSSILSNNQLKKKKKAADDRFLFSICHCSSHII